MAEKHPGGRPPKYKSVAEMQKKIDEYFASCKGELLRDENGIPELDKHGRPIYLNAKPPTVTGLALALGFTSRQALLNYQAKKQFVDTISRAKSFIEEYLETRLFDKEGVNGAKFSLSCNFKGWNVKEEDKKEETGAQGVVLIPCVADPLSPPEEADE